MSRVCDQEHNLQKVAATIRILVEAMDRMREKARVDASFKWTKDNWAKESGRHISTILRKNPDGSYVFADQIEAFERGLPPTNSATMSALRDRNKDLEAQVKRLELALVKAERERIDAQRRFVLLNGGK